MKPFVEQAEVVNEPTAWLVEPSSESHGVGEAERVVLILLLDGDEVQLSPFLLSYNHAVQSALSCSLAGSGRQREGFHNSCIALGPTSDVCLPNSKRAA